jgi:hypothetical protein
MNRNRVIQLAALFLMAALSPSVAQAQVVTLARADIAASVEKGMECYIHPNGPGCSLLPLVASKPDCSLYWASRTPGSADRVRVSRLNSKTVRAEAHMKCEIEHFRNPDVYIRLELAFSCSVPNPTVTVWPANVDVEVDWPWWVDLGTVSVTSWIGQIKSRTTTSKFRASDALQAFVRERMIPREIHYCPGISVQSNGDVRIDLAMGTECTNGQTQRRRCSANQIGPGLNYLCVGGRWENVGGSCEPKAPPGGQPP